MKMATLRNLAGGFLVLILGATSAWSQDRNLEIRRTDPGERRVALVIGQSAYKTAPLKNPVNDARAIARALRAAGFEVTLREDLNQRGLFEAAREFGAKLREDGVALFYYAGHGMQVRDRNYLIPVEADIQSELEVPYTSLDVNFVLDLMGRARSRMNLVVLDACRNNPFARSFRSAAQGLAQMEAPGGTLIAYATAPGKVASDGAGDNGLYTQYLLKHLPTPGLPVEIVFKRVREDVERETKSQQVPWESSSVKGDFYFVPAKPAAVLASVQPQPAPAAPAVDAALQTELAFWDSIKASSNASDYEAYLTAYPNGRFAPLARARVNTLQQQAASQGDARDLAFWDSIKLSTNPAEYEAYLAQFPKGQFASLARARAQALRQPVAAIAPAPLAAPPKPAAPAAALAAPAPAVAPAPAAAPPVQIASAAPSSAVIAAASGRPAPGERWVYQYIDLWKPAVRIPVTHVIQSVGGSEIVETVSARSGSGTATQESVISTGAMLRTMSVAGNTFMELFPFARVFEKLRPGQRIDLGELPDIGGIPGSRWTLNAELQGEEDVTTPAGRFRAMKVRVTGSIPTATSGNPSFGNFTATAWYAPEVKRYVRLTFDSSGTSGARMAGPVNRDVYELVAMPSQSLAAPPGPVAAAVPAPAAAPPVQIASAAPSSAVIAAASGRPAPGERWVYQYIDLWKPAVKHRVTLEVTEAGEGGITEKVSARIGARSVESETVHKNELALRALPLGDVTMMELSPFARNLEQLKPGQSFALREVPQSISSAPLFWNVQGRVQAEEEVTTPAGKFRAWKVAVEGYAPASGQVGGIRRFALTAWYAPEVKRYVRLAYESFVSMGVQLNPHGRDVLELVEVPR